MRFELNINCDNAAFEGDAESEVARILIATAKRLRETGRCGKLMDANGNSVGEADFHETE
jgi:hypothetical protein